MNDNVFVLIKHLMLLPRFLRRDCSFSIAVSILYQRSCLIGTGSKEARKAGYTMRSLKKHRKRKGNIG
jgi:hypothetical protein